MFKQSFAAVHKALPLSRSHLLHQRSMSMLPMAQPPFEGLGHWVPYYSQPQLEAMSTPSLKELMKTNGLKVSGGRQELVDRAIRYVHQRSNGAMATRTQARPGSASAHISPSQRTSAILSSNPQKGIHHDHPFLTWDPKPFTTNLQSHIAGNISSKRAGAGLGLEKAPQKKDSLGSVGSVRLRTTTPKAGAHPVAPVAKVSQEPNLGNDDHHKSYTIGAKHGFEKKGSHSPLHVHHENSPVHDQHTSYTIGAKHGLDKKGSHSPLQVHHKNSPAQSKVSASERALHPYPFPHPHQPQKTFDKATASPSHLTKGKPFGQERHHDKTKAASKETLPHSQEPSHIKEKTIVQKSARLAQLSLTKEQHSQTRVELAKERLGQEQELWDPHPQHASSSSFGCNHSQAQSAVHATGNKTLPKAFSSFSSTPPLAVAPDHSAKKRHPQPPLPHTVHKAAELDPPLKESLMAAAVASKSQWHAASKAAAAASSTSAESVLGSSAVSLPWTSPTLGGSHTWTGRQDSDHGGHSHSGHQKTDGWAYDKLPLGTTAFGTLLGFTVLAWFIAGKRDRWLEAQERHRLENEIIRREVAFGRL